MKIFEKKYVPIIYKVVDWPSLEYVKKIVPTKVMFMYIIHFIGYFLAMISIVGFLIGIFRKDKRALHDLLSGTCVIIKER